MVELQASKKGTILVKAFDKSSKNLTRLILVVCNECSLLMSNSIISNDLILLTALLVRYIKDAIEIWQSGLRKMEKLRIFTAWSIKLKKRSGDDWYQG